MRLPFGGNTMVMKPLRRVRRAVVAAGLTVAAVALAGVGANAAFDAARDSTAAPDGAASTSPTPATTSGQSQDAHAIVVNHGDNSYRYALTLKVVQVSGDVADPHNAAVAVATDCSDCQTVAISLEGVLVYGDPTVFAPENVALAYNENCSNCATLAAAYQEVVQTSNRVRITGAGRQQIAMIRQDLDAIRHDGLSLAEIDARVNADAAALLQVLRNDVVPVGNPQPNASATPQPSSTSPSDSPPTPQTTGPASTGSSSTESPTNSPAPTDTSSSSPAPTSSG